MKKIFSILFLCLFFSSLFADEVFFLESMGKDSILCKYTIENGVENFLIRESDSIIQVDADSLALMHKAVLKAKEWDKIVQENEVDNYSKDIPDINFKSLKGMEFKAQFCVEYYKSSLKFKGFDRRTETTFTFKKSQWEDLLNYTDIKYIREYAERVREYNREKEEKKKSLDSLLN